jgi:hypothetical protein
MVSYIGQSCALGWVAFNEFAVEIDHDHTIGFVESAKDCIWHVALNGAKSIGRCVTEQDRCFGRIQNCVHGSVGHMGDIHKHTDTVHFLYNLATKVG